MAETGETYQQAQQALSAQTDKAPELLLGRRVTPRGRIAEEIRWTPTTEAAGILLESTAGGAELPAESLMYQVLAKGGDLLLLTNDTPDAWDDLAGASDQVRVHSMRRTYEHEDLPAFSPIKEAIDIARAFASKPRERWGMIVLNLPRPDFQQYSWWNDGARELKQSDFTDVGDDDVLAIHRFPELLTHDWAADQVISVVPLLQPSEVEHIQPLSSWALRLSTAPCYDIEEEGHFVDTHLEDVEFRTLFPGWAAAVPPQPQCPGAFWEVADIHPSAGRWVLASFGDSGKSTLLLMPDPPDGQGTVHPEPPYEWLVETLGPDA